MTRLFSILCVFLLIGTPGALAQSRYHPPARPVPMDPTPAPNMFEAQRQMEDFQNQMEEHEAQTRANGIGQIVNSYANERAHPFERLVAVYAAHQLLMHCHSMGGRGRLAVLVTDQEMDRAKQLSAAKEAFLLPLIAKANPLAEFPNVDFTNPNDVKTKGWNMVSENLDGFQKHSDKIKAATCLKVREVALTNKLETFAPRRNF